MKSELKVAIPEAIIALAVIVCVTIADVTNHVSPDAVIGVYASVLGYTFGRVANGVQYKSPGN